MDEDVAFKIHHGMQAMRRPWPLGKAVEVVWRALIFALRIKRAMVLEYAVCLVYLSYYTGQLGGVLAWFYDIPPGDALRRFSHRLNHLALLIVGWQCLFGFVENGWQRPDGIFARIVGTFRCRALHVLNTDEHDFTQLPLYSGADTVEGNRSTSRSIGMPPCVHDEQRHISECRNVFATAAACAPLFCKLSCLRRERSHSSIEHSTALSSLRQVVDQCQTTEKHLQRVLERNAARYEHTYKTLKTNISNQRIQISHDKRIRTEEVKKRNEAVEKSRLLEEQLKVLKTEMNERLKAATSGLQEKRERTLFELEAERHLRKPVQTAPGDTRIDKLGAVEPSQDGMILDSFYQLLAAERSRVLGRHVVHEHALAQQKAELKRGRADLPITASSCKIKCAVAESQPGEVTNGLNAMEKGHSCLQAEIDESKAVIINLQAEVFTLRQELLDRKADYERAMDHSAEVHLQLVTRVERLKEERRMEKEDECRVNAAERRALLEEIESERAAHKNEVEAMTREMDKMKRRASAVRRDILNIHDDISKQLMVGEEVSMKGAQTRDVDSSTPFGQVGETDTMGDAADNGVDVFEDELNELYAVLDKEQKRADDLSSENASLQLQLTTRLATIDFLCTQLARESKKVLELEQTVEPKEKEIAKLCAEVERLEKEREEARKDASQKKVMIYELNTEVKQLWAKLEEMKTVDRVSKLVDEEITSDAPFKERSSLVVRNGTRATAGADSEADRLADSGVGAISQSDYAYSGNFGTNTLVTVRPYHSSNPHMHNSRPRSGFIPGMNLAPALGNDRSITPQANWIMNSYPHAGFFLPARRLLSSNGCEAIHSSEAQTVRGSGFHLGMGTNIVTGIHYPARGVAVPISTRAMQKSVGGGDLIYSTR